jgi:hypothetical protein
MRLPALQLQNDRGEVVDVDYALADLWQLQQHPFKDDRQRLQSLVSLIDQLLTQEKYGILNVQDGGVLLQNKISSKPQAMTDWLKLRSQLQIQIRGD